MRKGARVLILFRDKRYAGAFVNFLKNNKNNIGVIRLELAVKNAEDSLLKSIANELTSCRFVDLIGGTDPWLDQVDNENATRLQRLLEKKGKDTRITDVHATKVLINGVWDKLTEKQQQAVKNVRNRLIRAAEGQEALAALRPGDGRKFVLRFFSRLLGVEEQALKMESKTAPLDATVIEDVKSIRDLYDAYEKRESLYKFVEWYDQLLIERAKSPLIQSVFGELSKIRNSGVKSSGSDIYLLLKKADWLLFDLFTKQHRVDKTGFDQYKVSGVGDVAHDFCCFEVFVLSLNNTNLKAREILNLLICDDPVRYDSVSYILSRDFYHRPEINRLISDKNNLVIFEKYLQDEGFLSGKTYAEIVQSVKQ